MYKYYHHLGKKVIVEEPSTNGGIFSNDQDDEFSTPLNEFEGFFTENNEFAGENQAAKYKQENIYFPPNSTFPNPMNYHERYNTEYCDFNQVIEPRFLPHDHEERLLEETRLLNTLTPTIASHFPNPLLISDFPTHANDAKMTFSKLKSLQAQHEPKSFIKPLIKAGKFYAKSLQKTVNFDLKNDSNIDLDDESDVEMMEGKISDIVNGKPNNDNAPEVEFWNNAKNALSQTVEVIRNNLPEILLKSNTINEDQLNLISGKSSTSEGGTLLMCIPEQYDIDRLVHDHIQAEQKASSDPEEATEQKLEPLLIPLTKKSEQTFDKNTLRLNCECFIPSEIEIGGNINLLSGAGNLEIKREIPDNETQYEEQRISGQSAGQLALTEASKKIVELVEKLNVQSEDSLPVEELMEENETSTRKKTKTPGCWNMFRSLRGKTSKKKENGDQNQQT